MRTLILILTVLTLASCSQNGNESDAYGNFEAVETLVSSEMNGKLIQFDVEEGKELPAGEEVGFVDTIMLTLQLGEIDANKQKLRANLESISAQTKVLEQTKANLQKDLKRITKMRESGAATQKQLDDITGGIDVVSAQILASNTQRTAIASELSVIESKEALVVEHIKKCRVINPKLGTVLEKYAEQGEITAAGKPLYKIADLGKIILRAYVSGSQLSDVKLGTECIVLVDSGEDDYKEYQGQVIWVSGKAEFTPKIIQTKEERVNMVYAVKIEVVNDGSLKIGMPGEAIFGRTKEVRIKN